MLAMLKTVIVEKDVAKRTLHQCYMFQLLKLVLAPKQVGKL